MSNFTRMAALAIALLTVLSARATVVSGVIVGTITGGSDTLGLFGPAGGTLDGKTISIVYSYDTSRFSGPYYENFCLPNDCSYYKPTFSNSPYSSPSSVSVTVNSTTVRSSASYDWYTLSDVIYFYSFYFSQSSGLTPLVSLYVFGIDPPLFGVPIYSSSSSETGWVYLGHGGQGDSYFYFNVNPCATMIANGLKGPTLSLPSNSGKGTRIDASFTPSLDGVTPYGLAAAAMQCGFANFDWEQVVRRLPDPSPYYQRNPSDPTHPFHLTSLSTNFSDPIAFGYTTPHGEDKDFPKVTWNPLYYDPTSAGFNYSLTTYEQDGNTLKFSDMPYDSCIPDSAGNKSSKYDTDKCSNSLAPIGSLLSFLTTLVGVHADGSIVPLGPNFTWTSDFNGGIFGGIDTPANYSGVDPNSGVGGAAVTSTNYTSDYVYTGTAVQAAVLLTGSQVSIQASGLAYSRVSQTFNGTVTITNLSADAITGPFNIVFPGLNPGVTLTNSTQSFGGFPYLTQSSLSVLAPGQFFTVSLKFANPTNNLINVSPLVYAGGVL